MTDIVERLRYFGGELLDEAATEIEELRMQLKGDEILIRSYQNELRAMGVKHD